MLEEKNLPPGSRWRGVTLDYFDGRSWLKRVRAKPLYFPPSRQFFIQNPPGPGERISYQVLMEPSASNYLFTVSQILRLEGRLFPLVFDSADQSLTSRPHANQRLGYRGESWREAGPASPANRPTLSDLFRSQYLQLPALDKRIPVLARQVAGTGDPAARAARIEQYFRKNFRYSLEAEELDHPQPLAAFMFESKKGHCEYFATGMTILLRTLGIPARIVNGFQPGEFNEVADDYIIRGSDAHSWVEAFLPERGWQTFDPTPGSNPPPPRSAVFKALYRYWDAIELFWGQWILPYDDVLQASLFSDLQSLSFRWGHQGRNLFQHWLKQGARSLGDLIQKGQTQWSQQGKHWAALLGLVPLALGGYLLLRRIISRRIFLFRSRHHSGASRAAAIYREMLKILRKRGKLKPPAQTPLEFCESIPDAGLRELVASFTGLYNEIRFSPEPLTASQLQSAYQQLQALKHFRQPKPPVGIRS
jgi:transglutaminase-like putative cysteine protease